MMYDLQLSIGDICEDPTGLLVRVEDIETSTITSTSRSSRVAHEDSTRRNPEICPMWLSLIDSLSSAMCGSATRPLNWNV